MKFKGQRTEAIDFLRERISNMNSDQFVKIDFTIPRNYKFHKKFFSFCQQISYYQQIDIEHVIHLLKIETGHTEPIKYKGLMCHMAKSISFSKMSQDEFDEFYKKCMVASGEIWKNFDYETIKKLAEY